MSTLPLNEQAKNRHLIYRLDAAEELAFKQLTHAKALLLHASLSPDDSTLLGAALHAIVVNMHADGTEEPTTPGSTGS